MKNEVKVIGFDADDTLWVNEPYYREAEAQYARLLSDYADEEKVTQQLYEREMENLSLYGYGIKSFVISMIENAMEITGGGVSNGLVKEIIEMGRQMMQKPVEVLSGVEQVLRALGGRYRLIVVTKGDLLDQERKLERSGLSEHFHHIEIMSDKKPAHYQRLLKHLDISPQRFCMIGNSLRSDILPPLELGAYAIHVPYHITWVHEEVGEQVADHPRLYVRDRIDEVKELFA